MAGLPPEAWPPCDFPKDRALTIRDFITMGECKLDIPDGGLSFNAPSEIYDQHGHKLDGDYDPLGAHGCEHRDTPEWKAEHKQEKKHMPKQNTLTETISPEPAPAPVATAIVVSEPPPAPQTVATVGVDSAVNQMKSLLPAGADPALMVGGAAGLAIIGAAIKFGPSVLKARAERAERDHEAQMKKLELEEKRQEKQDDQHQQCNASRLALEARVAAAESKNADLERKVAEIAAKPASSGGVDLGDFDPDELTERLEELEKALKPKKRAGRGKKE